MSTLLAPAPPAPAKPPLVHVVRCTHPAADPTAPWMATTALTLVGADPRAITDTAAMRAALRRFARVAELAATPGRYGLSLRMTVEAGKLGFTLLLSAGGHDVDAATAEVHALHRATQRTIQDRPHAFRFDATDPAVHLIDAPRFAQRIVQRRIEVVDAGGRSASCVSRWEQSADDWSSVVDALLHADEQGRPITLAVALMPTTIGGEDEADLDLQFRTAMEIAELHPDGTIGQRARRVAATLIDLSESMRSPVFLAHVVVASDHTIPATVARTIACAITAEVDVVHLSERADMATSTVAARPRYVGGVELETVDPAETAVLFATGLPGVGTRRATTLGDKVTLTEAALVLRPPVPAGAPLPGIPSLGAGVQPEAPSPTVGARGTVVLGTHPDSLRPVVIDLFDPPRHLHVVGASGTGKSVTIEQIVMQALHSGARVLVLDGHDDVSRRCHRRALDAGLRSAELGADVSLQVLGSLHDDADRASRDIQRIISSVVSMWNPSWTGVRWRELAQHALTILSAAPGVHPFQQAREVANDELLSVAMDVVDDRRVTVSASAMRRALRDPSEVVGWLMSKFEVLGPEGLPTPFAAVGAGIRAEELVADHDLLVMSSPVDVPPATSGVMAHLVMDLIVQAIQTAQDGRPTVIVIDEAQRLPDSRIQMVATEGRKFGISLVVAHQHLSQLESTTRDALLDNAGTQLTFRVTSDAALFSGLFGMPSSTWLGLATFSGMLRRHTDSGQTVGAVRVMPMDRITVADRAPRVAPARVDLEAALREAEVDDDDSSIGWWESDLDDSDDLNDLDVVDDPDDVAHEPDLSRARLVGILRTALQRDVLGPVTARIAQLTDGPAATQTAMF